MAVSRLRPGGSGACVIRNRRKVGGGAGRPAPRRIKQLHHMQIAPPESHIAALADDNVRLGLLVLMNSLARNGFDGKLWIGQRASRPLDLPLDRVELPFDVEIVDIASERPFTYFKADFIADVWDRAEPSATSVCYMDSDLILDRDWSFVRSWVDGGLALVEDMVGRRVGALHPVRRAWAEFITACGEEVVRTPDYYYNAGFVGTRRSDRGFVDTWKHLALLLERTPVQEGPELPFVKGVRDSGSAPAISDEAGTLLRQAFLEDQDAFNMAIMATDVTLAAMGPDAMGFTGGRTPVVAHAVGPNKPWTKPYIRRLLRHGERVSVADDTWWKYSSSPIPVAAGSAWRRRRWSYLVVKTVGRLVGR